MPQGLRGKCGLRHAAADLAVPTAADDGDIECRFDLSQIFVQRAAKVTQPLVILRFEAERQRAGWRIQG
jgi:hypothetical protein